ncbi:MAG: PIN domain-containing protein [Actinomycetes bacterium]
MASPLVRFGPPRLLVGDTGVLMNEVVQGTRRGELTGLLAALHHDAARLYIAEHVLYEVERDLPGFALGRGVDPTLAVMRWHTLYLPHTVVVMVPETWGDGDSRVAQVANRHPVDLPTARLAVALAPCHGLIQDPDLTDNGFGDPNWLPLTLASANQAEMELAGTVTRVPTVLAIEFAKAAGRTFAKLPQWMQAVLLLAGLAGLYWWENSGKASQHVGRARELTGKAIEVIAPLAATVFERHTEAQATWETNVIQPSVDRTLSEQIARFLSRADQPMTATEMAKRLNLHGTLRERGNVIRTELRRWDAFTEVSRGRWQLGNRVSTADAAIQPADVADWLHRAHRGNERSTAK